MRVRAWLRPDLRFLAGASCLLVFYVGPIAQSQERDSCASDFGSRAAFDLLKGPAIRKARDSRDVLLEVQRAKAAGGEHWRIEGYGVVSVDRNAAFSNAVQFDQLHRAAPFLNVFRLSPDQKELEIGFNLLGITSVTQKFRLEPGKSVHQISIQLLDGTFEGLSGKIYFNPAGDRQTEVTLILEGTLPKGQVPSIVLPRVLSSLGRTVGEQLRKGMEEGR